MMDEEINAQQYMAVCDVYDGRLRCMVAQDACTAEVGRSGLLLLSCSLSKDGAGTLSTKFR